ncbi:hypothetical protein EN738_01330 [Mesorhizobium sp. M4B.F.Ca.ET.017.02.2.1]|nr:hypothetical protein EN738_01330 [Mesorhizobium sp. M4B.F.Ca.ET.017.02.2.1]
MPEFPKRWKVSAPELIAETFSSRIPYGNHTGGRDRRIPAATNETPTPTRSTYLRFIGGRVGSG